MDNDPAPPTPTEDPETASSTAIERQLRRLPTVLLNAAAVLSTTVMAVAIDPKNPPFRGDCPCGRGFAMRLRRTDEQ